MPKRKTLDDHLSEQGSWFCAVTHDMSLAENIKMTIRDFPDWAFIEHEPDKEDGSVHVHFMFRANGTRTIKAIANKIELPGNFIQVVKSEIGMRRYFMHLDDDEKKKYDVNDIHTNNHSLFRQAKDGNAGKSDIFKLYSDYCRLGFGNITPKDFILSHYDEMEKMPFSQKIKTFQVLNEVWGQHAHT